MKDLAEEAAADKIPDYPADYNNRGRSNSISFMCDVVSTSGRLHCELVICEYFNFAGSSGNRLLFSNFRS